MQQEESLERLRKHVTVLYSLPDAIVLADERGCIADINPAAEQLFGCTRQEALGNGIGLVRGGQLEPPHRTDPILQTLANGASWRAQVRIDRKGGESAVCESIVLPLKDADGSMFGMLGVNHELTESKRTTPTAGRPA
jgi:PAS domain S-box-containing protein